MKLNERQRRFAEEYVRTGKVYQSAINASYSEKYAAAQSYKLLEHVGIKAFVDKRMKELQKQSIAEQDEVLQFYTKVLRSEESEEVVLSSPLGVEKVNKRPDIRDRQRAAEELMKRYTLGNNQVLKDKLIEVQIDKLLKEMETDASVEDKLDQYFTMLDGVMDE